jgi:peptide/nickel transport system permease protein
MRRYVISRVLWAIPLMLGVTALVFVLINVIPGSPVQANPEAAGGGVADAQRLRELLGLDQPIWTRYFIWLGSLVHGDFGTSFRTHQSVTHEIVTRLPNTLALALASFVVAALIAIPMGAYAAMRFNRPEDRVVTFGSIIGVSLPTFWVGLVFILLFATKLHWFPAGGDAPIFGATLSDRARFLVLPAVTIAIPLAAEWTRYVRSRMLEVLPSDYVRSARAKGLNERTVLLKHAFRNARLPLIQLFGLSLPNFFAGALMVETVFNRSGIGRLTYDAAVGRDYPVVMGCVVFVGCLVVLGNLLADVLPAASAPRVRVG